MRVVRENRRVKAPKVRSGSGSGSGSGHGSSKKDRDPLRLADEDLDQDAVRLQNATEERHQQNDARARVEALISAHEADAERRLQSMRDANLPTPDVEGEQRYGRDEVGHRLGEEWLMAADRALNDAHNVYMSTGRDRETEAVGPLSGWNPTPTDSLEDDQDLEERTRDLMFGEDRAPTFAPPTTRPAGWLNYPEGSPDEEEDEEDEEDEYGRVEHAWPTEDEEEEYHGYERLPSQSDSDPTRGATTVQKDGESWFRSRQQGFLPQRLREVDDYAEDTESSASDDGELGAPLDVSLSRLERDVERLHRHLRIDGVLSAGGDSDDVDSIDVGEAEAEVRRNDSLLDTTSHFIGQDMDSFYAGLGYESSAALVPTDVSLELMDGQIRRGRALSWTTEHPIDDALAAQSAAERALDQGWERIASGGGASVDDLTLEDDTVAAGMGTIRPRSSRRFTPRTSKLTKIRGERPREPRVVPRESTDLYETGRSSWVQATPGCAVYEKGSPERRRPPIPARPHTAPGKSMKASTRRTTRKKRAENPHPSTLHRGDISERPAKAAAAAAATGVTAHAARLSAAMRALGDQKVDGMDVETLRRGMDARAVAAARLALRDDPDSRVLRRLIEAQAHLSSQAASLSKEPAPRRENVMDETEQETPEPTPAELVRPLLRSDGHPNHPYRPTTAALPPDMGVEGRGRPLTAAPAYVGLKRVPAAAAITRMTLDEELATFETDIGAGEDSDLSDWERDENHMFRLLRDGRKNSSTYRPVNINGNDDDDDDDDIDEERSSPRRKQTQVPATSSRDGERERDRRRTVEDMARETELEIGLEKDKLTDEERKDEERAYPSPEVAALMRDLLFRPRSRGRGRGDGETGETGRSRASAASSALAGAGSSEPDVRKDKGRPPAVGDWIGQPSVWVQRLMREILMNPGQGQGRRRPPRGSGRPPRSQRRPPTGSGPGTGAGVTPAGIDLDPRYPPIISAAPHVDVSSPDALRRGHFYAGVDVESPGASHWARSWDASSYGRQPQYRAGGAGAGSRVGFFVGAEDASLYDDDDDDDDEDDDDVGGTQLADELDGTYAGTLANRSIGEWERDSLAANDGRDEGDDELASHVRDMDDDDVDDDDNFDVENKGYRGRASGITDEGTQTEDVYTRIDEKREVEEDDDVDEVDIDDLDDISRHLTLDHGQIRSNEDADVEADANVDVDAGMGRSSRARSSSLSRGWHLPLPEIPETGEAKPTDLARTRPRSRMRSDSSSVTGASSRSDALAPGAASPSGSLLEYYFSLADDNPNRGAAALRERGGGATQPILLQESESPAGEGDALAGSSSMPLLSLSLTGSLGRQPGLAHLVGLPSRVVRGSMRGGVSRTPASVPPTEVTDTPSVSVSPSGVPISVLAAAITAHAQAQAHTAVTEKAHMYGRGRSRSGRGRGRHHLTVSAAEDLLRGVDLAAAWDTLPGAARNMLVSLQNNQLVAEGVHVGGGNPTGGRGGGRSGSLPPTGASSLPPTAPTQPRTNAAPSIDGLSMTETDGEEHLDLYSLLPDDSNPNAWRRDVNPYLRPLNPTPRARRRESSDIDDGDRRREGGGVRRRLVSEDETDDDVSYVLNTTT